MLPFFSLLCSVKNLYHGRASTHSTNWWGWFCSADETRNFHCNICNTSSMYVHIWWRVIKYFSFWVLMHCIEIHIWLQFLWMAREKWRSSVIWNVIYLNCSTSSGESSLNSILWLRTQPTKGRSAKEIDRSTETKEEITHAYLKFVQNNLWKFSRTTQKINKYRCVILDVVVYK